MADTTWKAGDRVRHGSMPDWGLGEVMAVPGDGKLRVHFEVGGERLLKNAPLTPATGEDLTRALPKPRGSGSGRPARPPKHKSFDEYRQVFLERFPAGFEDPTYLGEEREYKLQASQALSESLSASALGALVSDGSFEEVAQRVLAVVGRTKLMFPQEAIALKKGLEDPAARETLSRLLLDLLYGSEPYAQRFGAFCSHLEAIKAGDSQPLELVPKNLQEAEDFAMTDFYGCIREKRQPFADVRVGAVGALTAIMGREAIYKRRMVTWKELGVEV
jgi:hypothetical protein